MAANQRSTSATWGQGAQVKSTHLETIEANAAGAVNRNSITASVAVDTASGGTDFSFWR